MDPRQFLQKRLSTESVDQDATSVDQDATTMSKCPLLILPTLKRCLLLCCSCLLVVVLVHDMSLQLVWLEKSQGLQGSMNSILQLIDSLRPDELIWLHAHMTGRVHALMPATHLQIRRVKRVQTPRAKKGRRENMPGPSWKVARVQHKGTQNNRFSPSVNQLPPVSLFPPSTPLTHFFHLCPSVSPPLPPFC